MDRTMEKHMLDFWPSKESETGEFLQKRVEKALKTFDIPKRRILCLVSDGGSNMVKCAKLLQIPRVSCLAHLNDNVVESCTRSFSGLSGVVVHVKAILAHFGKSTKAANDLNSIQDKIDGKSCKLPSYSPTRWNGFYQASMKLVAHGEALTQYFQNHKVQVNGLSNSDVKFLAAILPFFKQIHDLTEEMIGHSDDASIKMPKRAHFLDTCINLVYNIMNDAYIAVFESWLDMNKKWKAKINVDDDPNEQNIKQLVATFLLEFAIQSRHYFIASLLTSDKRDLKYVCMDLAIIGEVWPEGRGIEMKEISHLLLAKFPKNTKEIKLFCKNLDGKGNEQDWVNTVVYCEEDVDKSFVKALSIANHEEFVICLRFFRNRLSKDLEEIGLLSKKHLHLLKQSFQKKGETIAFLPSTASSHHDDSANNSSIDLTYDGEATDGQHAIKGRKRGNNFVAPAGKKKSCLHISTTDEHDLSTPIVQPPHVDILEFWEALYHVPPTSVDIERMLSIAIRHIDDLRSRIRPETFASEILLLSNYRLMGIPMFFKAMNWPGSDSFENGNMIRDGTSESLPVVEVSDDENTMDEDLLLDFDKFTGYEKWAPESPGSLSSASSLMSDEEMRI